MKNLPKVMSNMYGAGGGMPGNSPTFKITMKEYEDVTIKVGDRVGMEINKVDMSLRSGISVNLLCYTLDTQRRSIFSLYLS
jgi:hypothetical protein